MNAIKGLLKSKELEDTLRAEIKKRLKEGDPLLPELQMAKQYNVGRITVRKAVESLVKEGLLQRIQGKGTFVTRPDNTKRRLNILIPQGALLSGGLVPGDNDIQADGKKWRVRLSILTPNEELDNRSPEIFSSEDADLVYAHEGLVPCLAKNGLIARLDGMIEKSKAVRKDDFDPRALGAFSWGGSIFGLPVFHSTLALFYNKDIFDAYGLEYPNREWTWDKMLRAASAMTGKNKKVGPWKTFGLGFYPGNRNMCVAMVRQNGGDFYDADGRCVLDSPESVEAMQFCADLFNRLRVVPAPQFVEKNLSLAEMFRAGYLGMFMGFYDDHLFLTKNFKGRWGVSEPPMRKKRASPLSVQGWVLPEKSKRKDEAFAFLESFFRNFERRPLLGLAKRIPSFSFPSEKLPEPFARALDYARPTHNSTKWVPPLDFHMGLSNLWMGIEDAESVCSRVCGAINGKG